MSLSGYTAGLRVALQRRYGYQTGQADKAYGNDVYDAQQRVLQYLTGLQQQNVSQRMGLQGQLVTAAQNAFQNYVNYVMQGLGNAPQQQQQAAAPARSAVASPVVSAPARVAASRPAAAVVSRLRRIGP